MGRGILVAAAVVVLGAAAFLLLRSDEEATGGGGADASAPTAPGSATAKKTEAGPAAAPAPVPVAGDGGVDGMLLRSLTGLPVPGAASATIKSGAVVTASAGIDGVFRIRGLPRGEEVRLEFASPGLRSVRIARIEVPRKGFLGLEYVRLGEAQRVDVLVVDRAGRPVAGCAVTALPLRRSFEVDDATAPEEPEASVTTDAEGRASLDDLPVGPGRLRAAAAGFASADLGIDLVEGELREPVRIVLAPGFALQGRVLHDDGRPAAGAVVLAVPAAEGRWWEKPGRGVADAEGRFRLDGLPAGSFLVSVSLRPGILEGVATVLLPAEKPLEIRLAPRVAIAGKVVDDRTEAPIEGASVSIVLGEGQNRQRSCTARTVTGADGTFRIADLPAMETETIDASKAGYFEAPAARGTGSGGERFLRLRRGAAVRGVVREVSGAPVSMAWVRIMVWRGKDGAVYVPPVHTDAEGRYEIQGVPPGRGLFEAGGRNRHLSGVPEDSWNALRSGIFSESCSVEVPAEGDAVKDLVLVPDSRVEGKILRGDGTPAPGYVAILEGADDPGGGGTRGTASAADGSFTIEDLPPAASRSVSAYGPAGRVGGSAPFDLVESETTRDVTVVIAATASLSGRILGEDGAPVRDATLELRPVKFDPEDPWQWTNRSASGTRVPVAADGTFRAEGLAPGPWTPFASAPDRIDRRSDSLELAAGEALAGVEIRLVPAFTVAGRVVSPTGEPVAGARVACRPARPPTESKESLQERLARARFAMVSGNDAGFVSDTDGRFRIPGVAAGECEVSAVADGFVAAKATVAAGAEDVVLRLEQGLSILGKAVEKGSAKPAAGVQVTAHFRGEAVVEKPVDDGDEPDFQDIEEMVGRRTRRPAVPVSADGTFELKGLSPGNYDLSFVSGNAAFASRTVHGVAAGAKGVVVELHRGLSISGRVEDAGGQPLVVQGLVLSCSPVDSMAFFGGGDEVGPDGAFLLEGLAPGRYRITVGSQTWNDEKGVYAERTVEAEAGAKDVVVSLSRGKVISGRVLLADGSAPKETNYSLELHPTRGGDATPGWEWVSCEEDGTFVTNPLPDGVAYDLEIQEHEHGMAAAVREVLPGATGVVIRFEKGGTIRGTVLDPEGKPLAGAIVEARPARGGDVRSTAESGPDGSFTIEGLPKGPYRLQARSAANNHCPVEPEATVAAGAEGVVVKTGKGFAFRAQCVTPDGKPFTDGVALVETLRDGRWEGPAVWPVEDGVLVCGGLAKCSVRVRLMKHGDTWGEDDSDPAGPFEVPGEEPTITLAK